MVAHYGRNGAGDRFPFLFGEGEPKLFGCYHPATDDRGSGPAAVICQPIGQEYIRSHRACLQLAIRLARAGIPAFRFDYRGTGDSGDRWEAASLDNWVRDVRRAMDHTRTCSGRSRIYLIGLRLGASLAAIAGSKLQNLAGLVLWNPVVSGTEYLAELADQHADLLRIAYVSAAETRDTAATSPSELLGFSLEQPLRDGLMDLDLAGADPDLPCPVLLLQSGAGEPDTHLQNILEHRSRALKSVTVGGPQVWLEDPFKGLVPNEALATIVSWAEEAHS